MKKSQKSIHSFEAVIDISYTAAKESYATQYSREIISQFIEWAKEF